MPRVLFAEKGAAQNQLAWSPVDAQPDVGVEFGGLSFPACQVGFGGFGRQGEAVAVPGHHRMEVLGSATAGFAAPKRLLDAPTAQQVHDVLDSCYYLCFVKSMHTSKLVLVQSNGPNSKTCFVW